jgi:phosphoglycolate phosphatase
MDQPVAVLFDIDETLVHTGGAGARSWSLAFEQVHGIPADIGEHSSAGETDPEVGIATFRAVIGRDPSPREMTELYVAYLHHVAEEIWKPGYRVLPDVDETLSGLIAAGVIIGVVSGAMEGAARIKLEPGHLGRYFIFGAYGSDSPDRDEICRAAMHKAGLLAGRELKPQEVWIVGDTPHDISSAHAVGAVGVGIATGHYSVEQLRAAGADDASDTILRPFESIVGAQRT